MDPAWALAVRTAALLLMAPDSAEGCWSGVFFLTAARPESKAEDMDYLWVGLGGFLGANARYALSLWMINRLGAAFPWHTLLINVTGSLAIGALIVLLTERLVADPAWRLLLVVGFLGGYTTFSSYTFEALALVESGEWLAAAWYVLSSNGLGLVAVYVGMLLIRGFSRSSGL
jgi:CrcB protein